jgi:hypothetical protein
MHKNTPGSNMFWESSRIMLPEHKAELLKYQEETRKKPRPELDEQEQEDIARGIGYSYGTKQPVSFILYGEFEDRTLTGVVTKVDQQLKRIKVEFGEEWEWVNFKDIIKVELK